MNSEPKRFEIAATAKLRHGELWKLVEKFGTQVEAARQIGVSASEFCCWLNMRGVPYCKGARFIPVEARLLALTGMSADELWPAETRTDAWLETPKNIVAYHSYKLRALADMTTKRLVLPSPADEVAAKEMQEKVREAVAEAISRLPLREGEIIKLRYGIYNKVHTLAECATILKLSAERIRQLEAKAVRKLGKDMKKQGMELI